ncbi:sugar phosphate nucleotidyltransferase [Candidatus Laterigemmans baculatus]|uniref:sugar phosphate nucleotidyltransferase n=1 Tax=Candidatus Laterigemmans baculatus TaxID=2770505 RepID=UPI0021BCC7AB|nr:NTP transferase domain-containing protein [Candidatus Laterigemmans baculatus]
MAQNDPIAVVLAAGKGTRMKSDLAKVLFPVCGRPMIHFVLDALAAAGAKRQIVVVGYQAERVRKELAGREGVEFVEQAEQLGTGHAVQVCRDAIAGPQGAGESGGAGKDGRPVIVVTGDSPLLQTTSLRRLLDRFEQTHPAALLGTLVKADPTGLGRIVRDPDGRFARIVEHKDASDQERQIREVNMSTYVFNAADLLEALEKLRNENSQGEYYLTDAPGILLSLGRNVEALPVLEECEALSINTTDELEIVEAKMQAMGYPLNA